MANFNTVKPSKLYFVMLNKFNHNEDQIVINMIKENELFLNYNIRVNSI